MLAASAAPDEPTARAGLLRACVLSVHRGKASVTLARVPSNVVELLTAKMAEADPMAMMEMQLACPRCQRQWTALFDIASFLWTELSAWARRMLREVHALASVYGWSESEIVGMSPARRSIYLELIAA